MQSAVCVDVPAYSSLSLSFADRLPDERTMYVQHSPNLFIVDDAPFPPLLTHIYFIERMSKASERKEEDEKKAFKIHDMQVMWHKIASNHIIICVFLTN